MMRTRMITDGNRRGVRRVCTWWTLEEWTVSWKPGTGTWSRSHSDSDGLRAAMQEIGLQRSNARHRRRFAQHLVKDTFLPTHQGMKRRLKLFVQPLHRFGALARPGTRFG